MSNATTSRKSSICSWLMAIILVAIIVTVIGVLVWKFAPYGTNILPTFNGTNSDQDNDDTGDTPTTTSTTTSPPTASPAFDGYQFIQCQDMENCCNGLEETCDLGPDEILWATSHNAPSTNEDGFIFGYNHLFRLETSLRAGYRALSIDICNCGGEYQLCHGICDFGARNPVEVFGNIVSFLEENPSEIIMINAQIASEVQGEVRLDQFSSDLEAVPGFYERLYVHDPSQSWPTMRTLIETGKTILLFHFNGPDCTEDGSCPPGFHWWFDYAAETEFEFTNSSDFDDTEYSCRIGRGDGSSKEFFAVTSFVTPPSQTEAEITNTRDFLESRLQACSDEQGLDVNLLYVDFWNVGDLPEVVQTYNKALGQRRRRQKMLR